MSDKAIYLTTRCPLDQVGPKHSGSDKALCGNWCQWFDPLYREGRRTGSSPCRMLAAFEEIAVEAPH